MTTQNDSIFGSSSDVFRVDQEGRKHSFAGTSIQCIMLFPHVEVRGGLQHSSLNNGVIEPGFKFDRNFDFSNNTSCIC